MNLITQLRVKGWVAITLPVFLGFFLNELNGFSLRYCALICALFLVNGFWYFYNDYEDAVYDKEDSSKKRRNVFCGEDRRKIVIGKIIIFITPLLSVFLGLIVSIKWAIFVFGMLLIAYLYSASISRAKARPFWDWLIHLVIIPMMFVPGYLLFFPPDKLFYVLWTVLAVNSLIAQINNQLRDFVLDSLSEHRTTAIILGKRNTFYFRLALELLLVSLIIWVVVSYRYYGVLSVLIPSFLYFLWVERIKLFDMLDTIENHINPRFWYLMSLWGSIFVLEAGIKKLL